MRKFFNLFLFFILCFLVLFPSLGLANNVVISDFGPNGKNENAKSMTFRFKLAWDNSFRTATNYDAIWLFLKIYNPTDGLWYHGTMKAAGTNPSGTSKDGTSCAYDIVVPTDKKGFFIQRDATNVASGSTNPCSACDYFEVTWHYGYDEGEYGIEFALDSPNLDFRLFAIEMVYLPQASFYIGDTASDRGQFEDATSGNPKQITSEGSLTLGGGGAGSVGNNNATGMTPQADDFNDGTSVALPADFPKGYNDFYLMKYEITQGQYRDFLNTLTYTQQATRTANAPNSAAGTGALDTANTERNGLDIKTPGVSTTTPAVYGCNLDGDTTYDEATDGEWIGLNFVTSMDNLAYLDWATLRPITDFEYEKAARGNQSAVLDEFAWGTTTRQTSAYTLSNSGEANEGIATNYSATDGNASISAAGTGIGGPIRVGIFAANGSSTGRTTSGAGYYGNMELTGSVGELMITVGNTTGRAFTGLHGDGQLNSTGNMNVSYWPTDGTGIGMRGTSWGSSDSRGRTSSRESAARTNFSTRGCNTARGARTAP
jgi:formylglycine-generating enzyme required for sulfatase activity